MKHPSTAAIALVFLLSCAAPENADTVCYRESKFSFYDPSNKDFTIDTWIRKPENIRMVHETLKRYGYNNIFSDEELTLSPCIIWRYINKPCNDVIDSLIITYPHAESAPVYYREFWSRRKAEQNDTTVFAVLKEVKQALIDNTTVPHNAGLANDTLFNLVRIKYKHPEGVDEALKNFDYLTAIGLDLSAYNMLFEWSRYDEIRWDRDGLKERLVLDNTNCYVDPVIEDDTK